MEKGEKKKTRFTLIVLINTIRVPSGTRYYLAIILSASFSPAHSLFSLLIVHRGNALKSCHSLSFPLTLPSHLLTARPARRSPTPRRETSGLDRASISRDPVAVV